MGLGHAFTVIKPTKDPVECTPWPQGTPAVTQCNIWSGLEAGKSKLKNCCCYMSISDSAPIPSSLPGLAGRAPPTWTYKYGLPFNRLELPSGELLAECFLNDKDPGSGSVCLRRGKFDASASCKHCVRHGQDFLKKLHIWGNTKPLLGAPNCLSKCMLLWPRIGWPRTRSFHPERWVATYPGLSPQPRSLPAPEMHNPVTQDLWSSLSESNACAVLISSGWLTINWPRRQDSPEQGFPQGTWVFSVLPQPDAAKRTACQSRYSSGKHESGGEN